MAKVIVGNATAITVPRQERNRIRNFYCGQVFRLVGIDEDLSQYEREVPAASRQARTKSRTASRRSPRRQAIASRAGDRSLTGTQTIPGRA